MFIWGIILIVILMVGIFIFWDILKSIWDLIPNSFSDLKKIFFLKHWALFYFFSTLAFLFLLYKLLFSVMILISLLISGERWLGVLGLFVMISSVLPIIIYFITWYKINNEFYFSFSTFFWFIGFCELLIFPISMCEDFLLGTNTITIIIRIIFYWFLLSLFF